MTKERRDGRLRAPDPKAAKMKYEMELANQIQNNLAGIDQKSAEFLVKEF
jgi:hypothetical protein